MKHDRSNVLNTFLASLISGGFVFLFLFAVEIVFTYSFSKKIHYSRIPYFLAVYVIIGAVLGLSIWITQGILVKLLRRRNSIRPDALFFALAVCGFLFFFSIIVLNALFLPGLSLFSGTSLLLDFGTVCLILALLFFFYRTTDSSNGSTPLYRTLSVSVSMAAIIVVFHVVVSRRVWTTEPEPACAASLTFLFILVGAIVAFADTRITNLIAAGKRGVAQEKHYRSALFVKILVVAIVLAATLLIKRYRPLVVESESAQSPAHASDKPNIILIVLDTVRQDRLSTYGCQRETTPNLTRLASEAWIFDAYATASWTLPSHATIVTGLYPTETGTGVDSEHHIDPRNRTLAEILRENHYSTAAFIANYGVLSNFSGFAQGFDYYYADSLDTEPPFPLFASFLIGKFFPDSPAITPKFCMRAESINRKAVRWIRKRDRKPFFLFLNYMDAHFPYDPPPPYNRRWSDHPPPASLSVGDGIWMTYEESLDKSKEKEIEAERAYLLSQYDGEIAYLDEQIAIFLSELDRMGIFDESLIIITSDHGEFFSEHGMVQHPQALYQEAIRVPLIVKPPGGRNEQPGRIAGPVSLVDLQHSILQYVDVPHESREGSANLFEREVSSIFSEAHQTESREEAARFGPHMYSLIQGNYKLIYSSRKGYEFYDLARDPAESRNLIPEGLPDDTEAVLTQMKAELDSRIMEVNANKLVPKQLPTPVLDEIRSRLKALGYIQ